MKLQYYFSAITAFLIWGIFSLVLKPLSSYPSIDILLYRIGFACVVAVLISFVFRRKITRENLRSFRALPKKDKWYMASNIFVSGIALAANWFFFIYVMNNVSVNATSLAYLICPILTTVLASIFLREKLNKIQWIAVGISVFSCILLSYGHFLDVAYSFVIAISYAIYLVLQKRTQHFDKFFILTVHIVLCSILLLPLVYLMPPGVVFGQDFYVYVLLIAVLFTIVPLFLNTYALKGLDSSLVGVLLYLNPIISFLLAVFYFHEGVNTIQGIAYFLIFTAVVLFNVAYMTKKNTDLSSVNFSSLKESNDMRNL